MKVSAALAWGACLAVLGAASAEEGKWTPAQLLQFDSKWLKRQGLEVPVSHLWDAKRGTGLLAATINTGNCSAGFVSPAGLFLTNRHCLYSLIQEHSSPGRDLLANGFVARSLAEELRGKTARVSVPHQFIDVTHEVEAASAAGAKAGEARQKELIGDCEKTPGVHCSISVFEGGLEYVLTQSVELTDVRLVYAPPRAIGEFGGEADNYRWPRHTGDFALARAYKDGKPYEPEFYFAISREGVKPGDFVMVPGYPFKTVRSLTADEMALEQDFRFRYRGEIYAEWVRGIEAAIQGNQQGEIAVAATLKSLRNLNTNAQAMVEGLVRDRAIENQRALEEAAAGWAVRQGGYAAALEAKKALDRLVAERRRTANRDTLFALIKPGAMGLRQATTIVRLSVERAKPDGQRAPEFMARELPALRNSLERDQKSFFEPADKAMLQVWLDRAARLGTDQRIAAVDRLKPAAAALLGGSKVSDLTERMKMFEETTEQLHARQDPLLEFAFALEPELRAWQSATQASDSALARLRPQWRRAVLAQAGKPVAPDANNTLRISLGHVKGYASYAPWTTLAGMIERSTGRAPFDLPQSLLDAAKGIQPERMPLNFLADADTTGGNSGSPVLNGRGEMIGLNFDRPWENVASDFGYNPEVARNISVDIRFFLWLLETVEHGDGILKELRIKPEVSVN